MLVAFEFTGALLMHVLRDHKAMSVDQRTALHGGPHYRGDVRDVIDLRVWDVIYMTGPPCYQMMRRDACLQAKMDDGRAFWGVALVVWCVCCAHAKALLVEQPDTIADDYLRADELPGVHVLTIRSSDLGDEHDKFFRFTLRNMAPLENNATRSGKRPRQMARRPRADEYPNAEERDRERSSWLPMPRLCAFVASMKVTDPDGAPPLDYKTVIHEVARRWTGLLPHGYDNPTGQPLDAESRAYQLQRGEGDGRRPRAHTTRVAERGDQLIVTHPDRALLNLVDRMTREGRSLTAEQERRLEDLEDYDPSPAGQRLFFWRAERAAGERACLSNFYQPVTIRDVDLESTAQFTSVEQYMHYAKSMLFDDSVTAHRLLSTHSPKECRMLGRSVDGYVDREWCAISRQVVERGVYLKFTQHEHLKRFLLSTRGVELIEASPSDAKWGIGVSEREADARDRGRWGTNWLGHALMRARARIAMGMTPALPRALTVAAQRLGDTDTQGATRGGQHDADVKETTDALPLRPSMLALSEALAPGYRIEDCGGQGECGFNSLARGAQAARLADLSGSQLRRRLTDHARALLDAGYVWKPADEHTDERTVRQLLTDALASWAPQNVKATAERWIAIMRHPGAWADQAVMALAADLFAVEVCYYLVDERGVLLHTDSFMPTGGVTPQARLSLALEKEAHYCVVLPNALNREARVEDEPRLRGLWRESGGTLVPTKRQWQLLLEAAVTLAEQPGVAPFTHQELAAIQTAMEESRKDEAATSNTDASEASRLSAAADELRRAVEASALELAMEESLRGGAQRVGSDGTALSTADIKPIEHTVRRQESAHEPKLGSEDDGLDSGSEFDEWGESPSLPAWAALARGEEVGAADEGEEMTALRGGADHENHRAPLVIMPETDVATDTVVIVPYAVHEGQPVVMVPTDEHAVLTTRRRPNEDIVEEAEWHVLTMLGPATAVTGFTGGRHTSGARLVVVAADVSGMTPSTSRARRQSKRAGEVMIWCTMLAVTACTMQTHMAWLAVATASHFSTHDGRTTALLQDEHTRRGATQWEAGRASYRAPVRASATTSPAVSSFGEVTPRELLKRVDQSLAELKTTLRSVGGPYAQYYRLWADAVKPLRLAEAAPGQLDERLTLDVDLAEKELFSPPLPVYRTPWLARAPAQVWEPEAGCEGFQAEGVLDLLDHTAREDLRRWFDAARKDAACLEERGAGCDRRDKPPTIAIGQDQVHECARGYVWDCRQSPCRLLDYTAPHHTNWDLTYLAQKLEGYPDQRLASNILEGVRLEADLDLMTVLSPQLVSIGAGYDSVQQTVRELGDRGFYDFFDTLPYWPIVVVGQGSRIKKLGSSKYRRTSNFSGPHKLVTDRQGNRAVPINEASQCYTIPLWLAQARRVEVREWARQKYQHVPTPRESETASPRHKFPKERKPHLFGLMHDIALLLTASLLLGEPIFVWVEDAAFYFNQFGYAPEELFKSNLIVGAREGDLTADQTKFRPGQLVFVSEKRLGFGSFASSNIAQRFSNALTGWVLEEFDRLEAEERARNPNPAWEAWIAKRTSLEGRCRRERPPEAREAPPDCTQTRLAVLTMFTDDPASVVVGVQRATRLLRAWGTVTGRIRLEMAGADKRQLGGDVEWIGVCLLAAIGLVAVPKNKLLRARDAIARTLDGKITFGEYRALVGLLEHLRNIAMLQPSATSALYRPHRREWSEHAQGPSGLVEVTKLMREVLDEWIGLIAHCAGAAVTIVFTEGVDAKLSNAQVIFAASSDAAGEGRGTPGIGGYMHGYYWRVALPPMILFLMHITGWETLAACINILVAARVAGPRVLLALQVDALLTPFAISQQRSKSEDIQFMLSRLLKAEGYEDIAPRLVLRHLSGDGNVPSDLCSRALWKELAVLCEALRVKPVHVSLDDRERRLVIETIADAAARRGQDFDARVMNGAFLLGPPPQLRDAAEAGASAPDVGPSRRRSDERPRELPLVESNEAVEAESMHGTSVHQGVAADSVAQADYDMASAASAAGEVAQDWRLMLPPRKRKQHEGPPAPPPSPVPPPDDDRDETPICVICREGGNLKRMQLCCHAFIHRACLKEHIRTVAYEDPGSDDELRETVRTRCPACNWTLTTTSLRRLLTESPPAAAGAAQAPPEPTDHEAMMHEDVSVISQQIARACIDNALIEAAARHKTSIHLGLAADSVSQADYDMASAAEWPIEHVSNEVTTVGAAHRSGQCIGSGLFAARDVDHGVQIAIFGEGAMMRSSEWASYCAPLGLPRWAGIKAIRRIPDPQESRVNVILYDASWRNDHEGRRPKWSFLNPSRQPNCSIHVPDHAGHGVWWETRRPVAAGEELTFEYNSDTYDCLQEEVALTAQNTRDRRDDRQDETTWKRRREEDPKRKRNAAPPRAPNEWRTNSAKQHGWKAYCARMWNQWWHALHGNTQTAATAPFVPIWACTMMAGQVKPASADVCEPRLSPHGPMSRQGKAAGQPFQPLWAPSRSQRGSGGAEARARSNARREAVATATHPYARPAYGNSKLRGDQVEHAKALARRLANDRTPGRIEATEAQLEDMAMAVAEARADGVNPRTSSKDAFALREFETYAAVAGFDPNLRSEWTRRFPERESLKLASWLLWRAQRAIPRSRKTCAVAKPMSIYQNYLALRRVFKSRNVELPVPGTVRETLRGLIRRFIRRFGIDALRPKRVEPVTPAIVLKCIRLAREATTTLMGCVWDLRDWHCFIVTAWMVINLSVGSRKGESTQLPGDVDENDWFTRQSVSYEIKGRTHVDPTEATLREMNEGDVAMLAPRGSKCDQWGTCHGTEPIILPYHDDDLNAARWLRDIELRRPAHGEQRSQLPLFADKHGRAYKDAAFATAIMAVLTAVLGEARAKLLSPHSWRVWLASSLRMAGASDARIQAMGRWLNPDSIKIYARMSKQEYKEWVDKLMSIRRIDTARTTSLPIMDAADAIAEWGAQLAEPATGNLETWNGAPTQAEVGPAPLRRNERLSIYWTDMDAWFEGTYRTSRVEDADGGGKQRASCIVYDAKGQWATCTPTQLTYWHCLDDELWRPA